METSHQEYVYHHPTLCYQRQFSYFDRHCHCWLDLHKYNATNINDNNTCNKNGCLREDIILSRMNTKRWVHSSCYWHIWMFSFSFWFIFYLLCTDCCCALSLVFFSPLMLISHYRQRVSIALQCAQTIVIF